MRGRQVAGIVGLVLHGLTGVFPYAASGLVAPVWGYLVLYVLWGALLVVGIRWFRAGRGPFVLLVPVASIAVWVAVMAFGDLVLGWSA